MASNFFEDDVGNKSSTRLMCLIALIAAIGFGYLTLIVPAVDRQTGIFITFGFLIAAFAPKTLQKYIELNHGGFLDKPK